MAATGQDLSKPPAASPEPRHDLTLREIEGPSALGGDLRRFAFLTVTIAVTEFKLRFYGSILGYFWQLFRPLLLFTTLYLVFNHLVKVGEAVDFYAAVLLMNIVLYTFFIEGSSAVTAVVDREQLVRKIQVPRLAIPLAVTLTASFNVVLNLGVVLIFAVFSGIRPHWGWLEVPFLLVALAVLAAGVAMLLSALYVRYRDVKPIWDVISQMLFYATPVIYVLDGLQSLSNGIKEVMAMNPLATILIQMRHAIIDPAAPSASAAVGGSVYLLIPIALGVGIVILGYRVFDREAPRIAEEL
ncbi:MAG: ABC transporter permease [Solirubrobacteraceae bacterium]|nr:ABC transporter permease [Solirubrobacteraceae bacterium]